LQWYSQGPITHITAVCVLTSYKGKEVVAVIKVFPVATKLTPFW